MALRDLLNKAFRKPTETPQRRQDDKPNIEAKSRAEAEHKTAKAIDTETARLHRTELTAELTPNGPQPKPALSDEQARDLAEKNVAAEARKDGQGRDSPASEPKKEPPEQSPPAPSRKADPLEAGAATPADIAEVEKWTVVHDLEADKKTAAEWTPEAEAALIIAEREARLARDAQSNSNELDTGRELPR